MLCICFSRHCNICIISKKKNNKYINIPSIPNQRVERNPMNRIRLQINPKIIILLIIGAVFGNILHEVVLSSDKSEDITVFPMGTVMDVKSPISQEILSI